MRTRAVVAIVLLLLPVALSAQRIPIRGGARRPRPAPLPPQPGVIARDLAYKRMRISFESYPMISYIDAPGFVGGRSNWRSLGTGTRADYRLSRFVSATMDVTSSFVGGPAITNTAELGTRLHRERTERRAYPFVDLRVGYMHAYDSPYQSINDAYIGAQSGSGFGYSSGFGVVGGVGTEYALTRRFSLTAGASVMRNGMTAYNSSGIGPNRVSYTLTAYRVVLGLRFNPVRLIRPPTEPAS
jgi:hypothetical protein